MTWMAKPRSTCRYGVCCKSEIDLDWTGIGDRLQREGYNIWIVNDPLVIGGPLNDFIEHEGVRKKARRMRIML